MTYSPFANRLKELMDSRSMSVAALARESGLKYHEVHTWFRRDTAKPASLSVDKVAKVLDVSSTFLLTGQPDPIEEEKDLGVRAIRHLARQLEPDLLRRLLDHGEDLLSEQDRRPQLGAPEEK
ncbi:MAG: helix-turn-helix transcriptional regulator [Roseobacter sp.]